MKVGSSFTSVRNELSRSRLIDGQFSQGEEQLYCPFAGSIATHTSVGGVEGRHFARTIRFFAMRVIPVAAQVAQSTHRKRIFPSNGPAGRDPVWTPRYARPVGLPLTSGGLRGEALAGRGFCAAHDQTASFSATSFFPTPRSAAIAGKWLLRGAALPLSQL